MSHIALEKNIYPPATSLDRLHWLWLALAAPFMLFPSSKRSLVMLAVPALYLLHWFVVRREQRATSHQVSSEGYRQRSAF